MVGSRQPSGTWLPCPSRITPVDVVTSSFSVHHWPDAVRGSRGAARPAPRWSGDHLRPPGLVGQVRDPRPAPRRGGVSRGFRGRRVQPPAMARSIRGRPPHRRHSLTCRRRAPTPTPARRRTSTLLRGSLPSRGPTPRTGHGPASAFPRTVGIEARGPEGPLVLRHGGGARALEADVRGDRDDGRPADGRPPRASHDLRGPSRRRLAHSGCNRRQRHDNHASHHRDHAIDSRTVGDVVGLRIG